MTQINDDHRKKLIADLEVHKAAQGGGDTKLVGAL